MSGKIKDRFHVSQYPRLKQVNALLDFGVITFGVFNLLLGGTLFFRQAVTNDFFLLSGLLSYQLWGTVFFLGGAALLMGRYLNHWGLMRQTLVFMLFTKLVWVSALTWRQINDGGSNVFLLLIFSLTAVLQFGMYLYFPVYKRIQTWKE